MTTLATDSKRKFEVNGEDVLNDLPVIASDIIYEGAAVGVSSGNMRPLVGGDVFQGFAVRRADNSSGAAGDIKVRLLQRGMVELSVTGASAVTDINSTVYATDDDTFTLTASGASSIGKVHRYVSGTTCVVSFEAASLRSI